MVTVLVTGYPKSGSGRMEIIKENNKIENFRVKLEKIFRHIKENQFICKQAVVNVL